MELMSQLHYSLRQLRLSGMLDTLEQRNRQAVDGQWSYTEFLAALLEDEAEGRKRSHKRASDVQADTLRYQS